MWKQRFNRVTYVASVLPLLSLLIVLIITAFNSFSDAHIFRLLTTFFLWTLACSYIASLLLGIAYGLIHRAPWVLAITLAAILDIGLFILALPDGETQVGWRPIDVILLGGLLILSILQIAALRKHNNITGKSP